jgi:hypothetical protein
MGGFLVGYATAWDAEILGVGVIAASNLGPSTMRAWARDPQEIQARFRANASRLAGTTSEKLLEEVKRNATSWNYLDYAPALKDRPVLIVEADDRNRYERVERLKKIVGIGEVKAAAKAGAPAVPKTS